VREGKTKWLSLILSSFLVLSIASMVHLAYAPVTLPLVYVDPAENTANPTESFTIDVAIQDVVDLYSYGIKVGFDFNVLSAVSVTEGPFLQAQPGGTFFTAKIEFDNVNIVGASLGAVPGISGSGTLFSVTFTVIDAGTSILDICDDTLVDSTLTAIEHETADGYFYTSACANLVQKSAWPEHHHFVVSKDEDFDGTYANQTLFAKVKNLGPIDIYAKVTFDIMRDDGLFATVSSEPVVVTPGTIVTLSADLTFSGADAGKYYASARAEYSWSGYYYALGDKIKTFSFAVVP
jgi:hypothetical protein